MTTADSLVTVDRDACVGSSFCVGLAAGGFEIDPSDGKVRVVAGAVVTADDVDEAVESCPVGAIAYREDIE